MDGRSGVGDRSLVFGATWPLWLVVVVFPALHFQIAILVNSCCVEAPGILVFSSQIRTGVNACFEERAFSPVQCHLPGPHARLPWSVGDPDPTWTPRVNPATADIRTIPAEGVITTIGSHPYLHRAG